MGNYLNPLSYLSSNNNDNDSENNKEKENFPKGTKYEEELNSNFKYFNVFWYDPNKDDDFDCFKTCFENVQFYKAYDLDSSINFFKKESISEWIVITPGSKGEELIKNLEKFECIKSFFVYCWNTELHEKWASKIKKVGVITSDPEILCQKFIELNKNYLIPKFDYKGEINIYDTLLNLLKIKSDNRFALNSIKREINSFIEGMNKRKNKYINFCIKSLNYLNGNEIENDFKETDFKDDIYFFHRYLNYIKYLTLLSLYLSQNPHLLNLLSFKEIKDLLKNEITSDLCSQKFNNILPILEKLYEKLKKNEYILDERNKNELKEIQIFCIYSINFELCQKEKKAINIFNFYQITNMFKDIDFCLKIRVYMNYGTFNNKNQNFFDEVFSSLILTDPRFAFFIYYTHSIVIPNELSEGDLNILNNSLTIKDFIIIGNSQFHKMIKLIENDLKAKSLAYLRIEQLSEYIKEKNNNNEKLISYFYFLIIQYEEYQKHLDIIFLLSAELGITFFIILFIDKEKENNYLKFFNYIFPNILAYSNEDKKIIFLKN